MRKILILASILSAVLISSCSHAQHNIHELSSKAIYPNCEHENESFKQLNSQWSISKFLDTRSSIQADINSDGREDLIGVFQPTKELLSHCALTDEADFTLFIDKGVTKPITIDLGIDYASVPTLKHTSNGFSLAYQTGQSTKCDRVATFTTRQMDNIYLSKIQLLCFIPNSDVGWQTKTFKPNTDSLITNVTFTDLFDDLEASFF